MHILHCPLADLNTACFSLLESIVLPLVAHLFKEYWEVLMSFLSKLIDVLLYSTIFFNLESTLAFQRSYLFKSNYWNEIREMSVLKSILENQASLVKDPTHAIQNMQSFDCLVFWKQKLTGCKIKMAFPWFFVSILNSDFGYIFWWYVMRWPFFEFQKQDAQVKTRGFIKKSHFFSTYFNSMHNNK
jgi:hypothetical protein